MQQTQTQETAIKANTMPFVQSKEERQLAKRWNNFVQLDIDEALRIERLTRTDPTCPYPHLAFRVFSVLSFSIKSDNTVRKHFSTGKQIADYFGTCPSKISSILKWLESNHLVRRDKKKKTISVEKLIPQTIHYATILVVNITLSKPLEHSFHLSTLF